MKTVIVLLVIFCAYSYVAAEEITPVNTESYGVKALISNCMTGVKSISFVLYTRNIPYGKNIGVNVPCDVLDKSEQVAVLVHGFISNGNHSITYKMARGLIKKNFTVFSLDWSQAACTTLLPALRLGAYPFAVKNVPEVGQRLAKYVISLIDKCDVSLDNIIFIGHSLGAHVCGFAAKEIQKLGYGLVSRILGADPAGPLFDDRQSKCEARLCDKDAKTTIVLHTTPTLGMKELIGHLDLYFNGGSSKAGCLLLDIECQHFNAMLYIAIAAEDTCRFPGVAMPYPEVTRRRPPYPQKDTSDCFVMNYTIFDNNVDFNKLKGKSYYMFEDSKTLCTQASFSCQN